jgi:hypothetical protein
MVLEYLRDLATRNLNRLKNISLESRNHLNYAQFYTPIYYYRRNQRVFLPMRCVLCAARIYLRHMYKLSRVKTGATVKC